VFSIHNIQIVDSVESKVHDPKGEDTILIIIMLSFHSDFERQSKSYLEHYFPLRSCW